MGTQKRALRASCDKCHQAKVKCVPTAVGCQRCLDLNSPCVHSPPGRSGRAPAASRESGVRAARILTPPQSNPSRAPSEPNASTTSANTSGSGDDDRHSRVPSSVADFSNDSVLIIDDDARQMEPIDAMLSDWFSMPGATSSPLYSGDQTAALPEFTARLPSAFAMTSPNPTAISDFAAGEPLTHSAVTAHSLVPSHPKDLVSTEGQGSMCACFQTIVRALEKIQQANMQLFSLDVALSQNKEALIRICNALECVSPHDSTTRLLILVLLRKALLLYHLLYQSRLRDRRDMNRKGASPITSPPPWSSFDTNITSANQQHNPLFPSEHNDVPTGPGATTAKLTLGSYQLDHADESSLAKQILLLDVNKVPRLLERLDRRACGLDEADGLDLYNMMRSALIAEFRAIMTQVER
ncbi:uncharacterized MFS-type transporter PB1E7.08c [Aspergillus lentulus]|nr:uncharacterized MFS-type transporter PB1E7.08c [Aspergillus lentulus]GFG17853.1 uncharacterized MFS-type transporter PB1E7.08c [Aspergillus lentulus]